MFKMWANSANNNTTQTCGGSFQKYRKFSLYLKKKERKNKKTKKKHKRIYKFVKSYKHIFFLCNHIHSNNWCNYWNILWKEYLNMYIYAGRYIIYRNIQIDWWLFSSSSSLSWTLNVIIYFRIIFNLILTGGVFNSILLCPFKYKHEIIILHWI